MSVCRVKVRKMKVIQTKVLPVASDVRLGEF